MRGGEARGEEKEGMEGEAEEAKGGVEKKRGFT